MKHLRKTFLFFTSVDIIHVHLYLCPENEQWNEYSCQRGIKSCQISILILLLQQLIMLGPVIVLGRASNIQISIIC